jgi:hypothetical protein
MIGQTETFEAIAGFLNQATQNSNGLRRAIDEFIQRLEILEGVSIITQAAKSSQIESCKIQRTPRIAEFHQAIERYQVANIEATQALSVAACIAKSIAEQDS